MPDRRPFLKSFEYRPWESSRRRPAVLRGYVLGEGNPALQVLVGDWPEPPGADDLRSLWKDRTQGRPFPLLVVGLHGDRAAICGPIGEDPPARLNLDPGQVERLCEAALREPSKEAANRYLGPALAGLEGPTAGVRNEGLFATHELITGVPARADWPDAGARSRRALRLRGRALLEALGFTIEPLQGPSWLLKSGDHDLAVAVFLDRGDSPDLSHPAYSEMSPVSYALARANDRNVPWVIIASSSALRIHPTDPTKGVGRRGRTDTFLELQLDLLSDERAGYLWLLLPRRTSRPAAPLRRFSRTPGASPGISARGCGTGSTRRWCRASRSRSCARGLRKVTAERLSETYEACLLLLFRLLFLAYAGDRDLLPYRVNGLYRKRSIKEMARELLELERNARATELPGGIAAKNASGDTRDIREEWMHLTDPLNLLPKVERLFRELAAHVRQHPADLGQEERDRLILTLEAPWDVRTRRAFQELFHSGEGYPVELTRRIRDLVRELGMRPLEPLAPLPPIGEDEIALVCWMVVKAT